MSSLEISKKFPNCILLMRNRKIGEEFRKFQEFDTPFPKIVEILGIMFFWYKIEKLVKNFIRSKIFKIPGISKILGKISRSIFCQLMFFWYKIEKLTKNFFRWRILKVPRNLMSFPKISKTWKYQEFDVKNFQEFLKFLEFDVISKNFESSWKNFCPNFLTLYQKKIRGGRWTVFFKFRKFWFFD